MPYREALCAASQHLDRRPSEAERTCLIHNPQDLWGLVNLLILFAVSTHHNLLETVVCT